MVRTFGIVEEQTINGFNGNWYRCNACLHYTPTMLLRAKTSKNVG